MTLPLAMIVKDEAACLAHCLASVQGLVDECVVVDTGSRDRSREIAREFGAQVHEFPWIGDFAAARNASLRPCTGDWILVLDADEAVDALDHGAIRKATRDHGPSAYELTLRNYCSHGNYAIRDTPAQPNRSPYREGREHPFYVDAWGLRLFQNLPGVAFTGTIHEMVLPFFTERHLSVHQLSAVIHHYGKLDPLREAQKAKEYLALATQDLAAAPDDPQALFNVVQQALQAEAWEMAVTAAQHFLEVRREAPPLIHYAGGHALLHLGRPQEALAWFQSVLTLQPSHAMARMHLGSCLAALGRGDDARRELHAAIAAQPTLTQAYLNLTELEFKGGHLEAAREALRQGLGRNPEDPLLLNGQVLFDLWSQNVDQAIEDARKALARFPGGGGGLWHRLVALGEHAAGRREAALTVLDQAIALFPTDPDLPRMRAKFQPAD